MGADLFVPGKIALTRDLSTIESAEELGHILLLGKIESLQIVIYLCC